MLLSSPGRGSRCAAWTSRVLRGSPRPLSTVLIARKNGEQNLNGNKIRSSFVVVRPPTRWFADYPPHTRVALPALSPTMEVGTIIQWEKHVGDQLQEGDLLCEIETDKATMGMETPEEGYLAKTFLPAGAKDIPIGTLLAIIVEDKEDVEKFADFKDDEAGKAAKPTAKKETQTKKAPNSSTSIARMSKAPAAAAPSAKKPASSSATSSSDSKGMATPAARLLAKERGVDLSSIGQGSGIDGIITTTDVERAEGGVVGGSAGVPSAFHGGMPTPMGEYSDAELSNMRKTIAKRLQASKLEIPHYYLTVECEMDALIKLRSEINKEYEKEGVKLSVNDFIIKATALASKRIPQCNSAWMDTSIREYHTCDVSVAVDTGSGLITPIVPSAENKGLIEISETIKELAGKAKDGKLQPHEFMGGTITVSNLGMFGIEHFTAIINPPQSCILAVGGTTEKAVPKADGGFAVKKYMKVTLSCDHRVVDGAVGAQWLKHFKKFLEKPQSMLL